MENHIQYSKITGFAQENFIGKWKLKLVGSVFQDDSTSKFSYDKHIIEIKDNTVILDQIEYQIDHIYKLQLPDIQTFIAYNEIVWRNNFILNPKLRIYKGNVVKYYIIFKEHVSIMDKNYQHDLFKKEPLSNFIKISENEFGFLIDNAYYKLIKIH